MNKIKNEQIIFKYIIFPKFYYLHFYCIETKKNGIYSLYLDFLINFFELNLKNDVCFNLLFIYW